MAKRSPVEQTLERLRLLRAAPSSPEFRKELAGALASKVDFLVIKAAELAAEFKVRDLATDLAVAFHRFRKDPGYSDKGCGAKAAIVKALLDTGADGPETTDVYLAGVRHFESNTAGPLRGYCGLGLLSVRHPDALTILTDLLADPEPPARVGAARGLAESGREDAALVLRFKLRAGDDAPEVLSECMAGVLRLDPRRSVDLVGEFLDGGDEDDEVRDAAALALGESRLPAALEPLRRALGRTRADQSRRTILLAVALLRRPESVEVLLSALRSGDAATAAGVIEALRIYRLDAAVRAKAGEAVEGRGDAALKQAFEAAFGNP